MVTHTLLSVYLGTPAAKAVRNIIICNGIPMARLKNEYLSLVSMTVLFDSPFRTHADFKIYKTTSATAVQNFY